MRRFWGKRKEEETLVAPNLEVFSAWIRFVVDSFKLKEGNYTLAAGLGGFLLFIKQEGIIWVPYSFVKNKMKKLETKDLAMPTAIGSGIALVSILHFPLATIFLINITLKKIYPKFLVRPPRTVKRYLTSEITGISIELISIQKWKTAFERDESTKETPFEEEFIIKRIEKLEITLDLYRAVQKVEDKTNLALRVRIESLFGDYSRSMLEKITKFVKSLLTEHEPDEFLFPFQPNLLIFFGDLERNGIPINFKNSLESS